MPIYFDEILLDPGMFNLRSIQGGPEFANANERNPQTGIMSVAVLRYDPSIMWQCNFEDIKFDPGQLGGGSGLTYFNNFWYGGLGSAYGFRVRNQFDYFVQGQVIGSGDGSTHDFKLFKTYTRPGPAGTNVVSGPYNRRIIKPLASSLLSADSVTLYESDGSTARVVGSPTWEVPFVAYLAGTPQVSGFTISNTHGILHFTTAPGVGVEVKVDFQFDVPMRFLTNIPQMTADFPAQVSSLPLVEILPAELGIT